MTRPDLARLYTASPYAAAQLERHPDWLADLDPAASPTEDYRATYAAENPPPADEAALMRQLRQYKHRRQIRHIHAVVNGLIDEPAFLARTSALAETLIAAAHDWQFAAHCARYGTPLDSDGNPMPMLILGMGKLGGGELNFSSDIDLIYAYRVNGTTSGGRKPEEHETWYRKLAQRLIHTLDAATEDGNVYRVDMRLRPFGQTGPLALSYAAMEQYYLIHGRDWERYALMKARPVAGDLDGGRELLAALRPFTYRRYLDYAALNALADMKQSINRQIREEGMERHIKLGAGGIREAEFTVQAMQMIYGGQYPALQTPSLLTALEHLRARGLMPAADTAALRDAYLTLRRVENALQYRDDQQTHSLPDNADTDAWQHLATACRAASVPTLQADIRRARDTIHRHYTATIADEDNAAPDPIADALAAVDWTDPDDAHLARWLADNIADGDTRAATAATLAAHIRANNRHRLPQQTNKHLDRLIPAILSRAVQNNQLDGLAGILDLITAVSGRNNYITLLAEQSALTNHLLNIAASAAWLIHYIAAHPLVLDDLNNERRLPPDRAALQQDLAARLQHIDDEETWQHALRDYKHVQTFKTAWADIHGHLPLMQVSDQLSHIAETTLQAALDHAAHTLQAKHGIPRKADGSPAEVAIIGYGKLGGLELGYGSDLDIIYLYDDGDTDGMTDGAKPIDNRLYHTRLAQRTSNLLSAASSNGSIYTIDTRLRPGGASGLPAISIQGFARYQQESAWTWEHQALTRSRPVAGSPALGERYTRLRHELLTRPAKATLREDILAMRQKMHDNAAPLPPDTFHLKQSAGGLIDIEFIVQYLLLAHGAAEPVLSRMSDNIRQLAALEATGILTSSQAMTLRDAYRKLRAEAHHRQLNDRDKRVPAAPWQALRDDICAIWRDVFATA
ncbi:bifunctional [glutamate--ammonia ligase]-adenylyl-L-tyrosine phosphorylase/[glutamate--ammonia-ligase] adenylyltransferase [uncultured Cardiobacterium sp.]|uniref:bifunctional [glutamate--ammonia ligase]-adenylyl-L-tyrosine phosphorylase/[glutamate--ammonia-ligase] adenylyltransferase n=1 Tax=uncultured Cardiobacterium sp. TaxID=417619 RepID=UPI0026219978|nr:bifunctional [glutamate--ammonia ligase]-adenylyl-L-tyrosine phosphorylase/[glutamate--ammonia-ligase] adenylyltransferase [uncultured Cardiobacterium sp.]